MFGDVGLYCIFKSMSKESVNSCDLFLSHQRSLLKHIKAYAKYIMKIATSDGNLLEGVV